MPNITFILSGHLISMITNYEPVFNFNRGYPELKITASKIRYPFYNFIFRFITAFLRSIVCLSNNYLKLVFSLDLRGERQNLYKEIRQKCLFEQEDAARLSIR